MAGLVDYEAVVLDLRGALQERASWGRAQVLGLIAELEQRHRVDESRDQAVLRRFAGHLTDTFFDLVPRSSATTDPLDAPDPRTGAAMDVGAASDHPHDGGDVCPLNPPRSPRRALPSASASPATTSSRRGAPATT